MQDQQLNSDGSINTQELDKAFIRHWAKHDEKEEMQKLLRKIPGLNVPVGEFEAAVEIVSGLS